MADHAHTFLLVTILAFVSILLVFGMKYFTAARQARLRLAAETGYRDVAEHTARAQSATAASLTSLQADLFEVKSKLAGIEKVLREVE